MTLRNASLTLVILSLLLAACGGGGSSGAAVLDDFNASEKGLVGTYTLHDFHIWEAGTPPCDPVDFEAWGGGLELRADRTACVRLELCAQADVVTAACQRDFVWSADAGTIHLESLDANGRDIRFEWSLQGMGALTTHSLIPTNDPNAGLLLFEEGYETLHWTRVP